MVQAPALLTVAPSWTSLGAKPVPLAIPKLATKNTNTGKYEISMAQGLHDFGLGIKVQKVPQLTTVWGYSDAPDGAFQGYGGPVIPTTANQPHDPGKDVEVNWTNRLPSKLPFAQTPYPVGGVPLSGTYPDNTPGSKLYGPQMWSDLGDVVPHLHGGHTDSQYDGLPGLDMFDGDHQLEAQELASGVSQDFYYSNDQPAATIWYHDHALGFTRLNVYAGLFGGWAIDDSNEDALATSGLPSVFNESTYDIPLVVQDKSFLTTGELYYPPVWVPEFFGNVAVVNGKAFPTLTVEPRQYRFRIINGAQARFFDLALVNSVTKLPLTMTQIAGDGGFLPATVSIPGQLPKLLLGPGERAEILMDFTGLPDKTTFTLTNDAMTPFSGGFSPTGGNPGLPEIMQFVVKGPASGTPTRFMGTYLNSDAALSPITPPQPDATNLADPLHAANVKETRYLSLNEFPDKNGLPIQMKLGVLNLEAGTNTTYAYHEDPTEDPEVGTKEHWVMVNNTVDVHPMHLHLVQFRVVARYPVIKNKAGTVTGFGLPIPPAANESGWKDTVLVYPNQATMIEATFDKAGRYVWHCHILDHEENDMMRPLEVIQPQ